MVTEPSKKRNESGIGRFNKHMNVLYTLQVTTIAVEL